MGEVTEHGFHVGEVRGVFAEGVIVGDGFGLSVDEEFVGISTAGFAVESGAPLAKNLFEFFLGMGGELLDGFDAEGTECAFGDFTDAGNFSDGKRGKEAGFLAGSNPDEAPGFALIRGDFGSKAGGGEAAGAGKSSSPGNGAKKLVGGGERRAMEALRCRRGRDRLRRWRPFRRWERIW